MEREFGINREIKNECQRQKGREREIERKKEGERQIDR